MRAIATALRRTYDDTDGKSRDSRVFGFVPMATWSVATSSLPAWMIVSSVYVYFETTATWIAASRLYARKPDVVSGTSVSEAWRTTHEPAFCRRFFSGEKCSILSVSRSPTTRSARPSTMGSTSLGMSEPMYWLSASVLTITSAPSFRHASRPAWKPAARPLLFVSLTMWSTPCSRATSTVRSVEPSSMMSHSTTSTPGMSRGRSASVAGSVASSLRQGIWMMSFIARAGRGGRPPEVGPQTGYGVRRRSRRSRPRTDVHWALSPFPPMASATLTRPRPGQPEAPDRRRRPVPWPALALAALALGTLVGFVVRPTFPNYDSYYSLLWGREVLHGTLPSFDAYRAPTEHPLAISFGAVLSLVGDDADRIMVGATFASFVILAAGMYRLGRASFGMVSGLIAAALLCTRFDFPFLAARAYIDIPYLALIVWAVALEAERPRRGTPVFVLLAAAGLLRPEAWLLSGLYWLWCFPPATWPQRVRYTALAAIGPVVWPAVDWIVTGDPKFSLTHTSGLAEELGRTRGLSEIPAATVQFLSSLDKVPVFYAGILGLLIAIVLVPRRVVWPLAMLVIGMGTFVLVGLAGLSVIDRYLLVPSLMVMVFAAVTLGGWGMLRAGKLRTAWAVAALVIVAYGVVFTATHVQFNVFDNELRFRGDSHAALEALFRNPKVRAAMACGPVSVPNHKLVPDTRWVLKAGVDDVIARSDPASKSRLARGVAVYATNRQALLRQGFTPDVSSTEDIRNSLPLPGYTFVAATGFYGAYVRC